MTHVTYETTGDGVARIRFTRPEKLNALSNPMHVELCAALRRFEEDPGLWVAVLSGEGRSFCAGRDIAAQAESDSVVVTEGADPDVDQFGLPTLTKLLITVGQGHVLGAGAYMFLGGDIRIAGRSIDFGFPELPTGVLGPYWLEAAENLPRAVAFRLALGQRIGADEVNRLGLVTQVVEDADLDATVDTWLDQLRLMPRRHIIATKELMTRFRLAYTPEVRELEYSTRATLDALEDTQEAARAFVERRQPVYTGS